MRSEPRKFAVLTIVALGLVAILSAACSSETNTVTNTTTSNQTKTDSTTAKNEAVKNEKDEIPAAVKSAFPDATSISKQHKTIPKDAVAEIEKETGAKISDVDHHSYLAFSTTGGVRKQIGAATVVKAAGKELVIVYENKDGMPFIKEIRADGIPADFLKQFVGKGHDDKFQIGVDLKASGIDEVTAKMIAQAVRIDALAMQALYGAKHTH